MDETNPGTGRKAAVVGVSVAILALLVYLIQREPAPDIPDAAARAPEAADAPADTAAGDAAPAADATAEAGRGPATAAPAAQAEDAGRKPGFDLVRVAPDGAAVVAGRAEPGATVTVRADDAPLAEVEADAQGNFVAIFRAEPSAAPRALTLEAETRQGGTTTSNEVVMLFPEAPAPAGTAAPPAADAGAGSGEPAEEADAEAVAPGAAGGTAAGSDAKAPAEAGSWAPAAAVPAKDAPAAAAEATAGEPTGFEPAAAEPAVAATAILRRDSVEVAPASGPGGGTRQVALASIAYADAGAITLAGSGTAGARLRAYVDDGFAREATVDAAGRWTMQLGDVAEGVYRLRIDQLGADGKVASRIETPFQRDFPRAPLHRPGAAGPGTAVTVQPGNNLWTLARLHYGSGMMYTQIHTANRELIRDPHLIYPGQIFNLPEMPAAD